MTQNPPKVGLAGSFNMPMRNVSGASAVSDDAVPTGDPNDTASLLAERLQAWKHAVGYLEAYVGATQKAQTVMAKEYEKVLKTLSDPLREGHHFDQSLGGVAGMFENIRVNTQGLANTHLETEATIKGTVLPILDRLHKEIKNKSKELASGAAKSAKLVETARNNTQKHIELLGQQTANYESTGGRMSSHQDPHVVHRQVLHRLNKQIIEENNNKRDLIAVQENFSAFENHVIEVMQQAMMTFDQLVGGQTQKTQNMYADMLVGVQRVPMDFEWANFSARNAHLLQDPKSSDRTMDATTFPNQGHQSTHALIEGTLSRKSRNKLSMAGYVTAYYVVSPSKFLHEFKENDNFRNDPQPELSIYLPDAVIGATNGDKFNIKGKDVSKGIGSKLSGSSELSFKAHTAADAEKWSEIIRMIAGATGPSNLLTTGSQGSGPNSPLSPLSPTSPTAEKGRVVSNPPNYSEKHPAPINTAGTSGANGSLPTPTTPGPHTSGPHSPEDKV